MIITLIVCVCLCKRERESKCGRTRGREREAQQTGYELNTHLNLMLCSSHSSVQVIHRCNYSKALFNIIQSHCDVNTEH